MCTRSIALRISIILALAVLVPSAPAQKVSPNSDPQSKPRKIKEEPAKAFKQWIVDVGPIISGPELQAWNKLKTDAEREQFIGQFWRLRDPDPATEENEYRESYYDRVAYVHEHCASVFRG